MRIRSIIRISAKQLLINKSKSFLATAGLSVGIAAVITMVSIGEGAKKKALNQLEQSGSNLIVVNAGKVKNVVKRRQNSDIVTTLSLKDAESIKNRCPSISEVVPAMENNMNVKYGNSTTKSLVHGVSVSYFKIKSFGVENGSLFTETDNHSLQRLAVLGHQVSSTLFGSENPIGRTIYVNKIPFVVTGILKPKGINADGANLDNQVLIPINTALRRVFNVDYLKRLFIEVNSTEQLKPAEIEIKAVLRKNHHLMPMNKDDDFTIDNQLAAIQSIESSSRSFTFLITGVAAIAILVGGTGILAVMLLSVKERTEEIGLRISFGAKRKDIVNQFITESSILGLTGGLTGLLTGFAASVIIQLFTNWQISLTITPFLISFIISVIIGLIFGVLPARKAAKADPISALNKD